MTDAADSAAIPWNSQTGDGQVLLGMPWEIFVLGCAVLSIFNLVLVIILLITAPMPMTAPSPTARPWRMAPWPTVTARRWP